MERLEGLRIDFRKNSSASKISSPCYVQSDEDDGMHTSYDDNYDDVPEIVFIVNLNFIHNKAPFFYS